MLGRPRPALVGLALSVLGATAIAAGLLAGVSVAFFAGILVTAAGVLMCAAFWGDG